jgi:plastocyanin
MFEKLRENLPRTQPGPRPSIVVTTKIDNPRLLDVKVDNSTSPSSISGTFGIDVTNTGLLATRSLRITSAKIDLTKNEQSINIGEIKKPQQIKDIPSGQTKTIKIKFDRKSNFINQIGEDVCNAKEIEANINLTVAEIILAATYSNKEKIKVNDTDCDLITVSIQGQKNVNVNQEYTWEIVASDGSSLNNVEWDMGDGTTKSGTKVSHTYEREGVFDITAETGGQNSDNIEVNVERLPLAIVGPTSVQVGKDNTWSPSGENVENLSGFSWSMGDGTTIQGEQASHSYDSEGTYTITLTSDEGTSTSLDIESSFPNITVQEINGREDVEDDTEYEWSINGNNLDKANEIRWDMGDGTIKYGQQVSHTYSSALESTINVSAKIAEEVVDSANSPILVRAIRLGSGEG